MSINDLLDNKPTTTSEYVVVSSDSDCFELANAGGWCEHIGDKFYKCKRIVAINLNLSIISAYPITIK